MADSSLDPDNIPETDRQLGKGHGTGALGPSDTSDSGSDMIGAGIGPENAELLDLDGGTTSDPEGNPYGTVGPGAGDALLDSDTDSGGTGQRASAGRAAAVEDGRDIRPDRIERLVPKTGDEEDHFTIRARPTAP